MNIHRSRGAISLSNRERCGWCTASYMSSSILLLPICCCYHRLLFSVIFAMQSWFTKHVGFHVRTCSARCDLCTSNTGQLCCAMATFTLRPCFSFFHSAQKYEMISWLSSSTVVNRAIIPISIVYCHNISYSVMIMFLAELTVLPPLVLKKKKNYMDT